MPLPEQAGAIRELKDRPFLTMRDPGFYRNRFASPGVARDVFAYGCVQQRSRITSASVVT